LRSWKIIGLLGLGIALGASAGAALWYAPGSASPVSASGTVQTTPLTAAPAPVVGAPAPGFSLSDLEGDSVHLSDLRGKTVIVNFWATWCEPCMEELPLLNRIALERADSLAVICIDVGEPGSAVRSFSDPLGLASIRILLDPTGQVRDLYLVRGYPTSFFVDPAGIIQRIKIGTLGSSEIEAILLKMGATS
jgi:cytochrome c biogenesis protein CcmG/thiol:disulfide interchange protein DsbE